MSSKAILSWAGDSLAMIRNLRLSHAAAHSPLSLANALSRALGAVLLLWLALAAATVMAQTSPHIQASMIAKGDTPRPTPAPRPALRSA